MPTVVNRIRAFLGLDDDVALGPDPASVAFEAPPKVIEAPPIEPYGSGSNSTPIVPKADPRQEYISGFGRTYQGFSYYPGGATTLDACAAEIAREQGPYVLEAMRRDPKVNASLNTRKAGILSGGLQLAPAIQADPTAGPDSDEANDPDVLKAAEIRDFCQRCIDRLGQPIEETLAELLDAMVYGVKLAETTFEVAGPGPDQGKLMPRSLRVKPNAAWAFVVDPALEVLGYLAKTPTVMPGSTADPAALASGSAFGGYAVLPAEKVVVFTWRPRDGDPRGTSILDGAFTAWNFKIQTWPELGRYIVSFGSATRVGETAPGAVPELPRDANGVPIPGAPPVTAEAALLAALQNSRNGGVVTHKSGGKVYDLLPPGEGGPFHRAIDLCNNEIVVAILEQERATQEATHGSKADSQTGQDILGQSVKLDKLALAHVARRQFLQPTVRLNYGDDAADRLTPLVSLGGTESQDRAQMLNAYAGVGYAIDPSQLPWIDHDLGIKVRDPEPEPQPIADQVPGPSEAVDGAPAVAGKVGEKPGEKPDQKPDQKPAKAVA